MAWDPGQDDLAQYGGRRATREGMGEVAWDPGQDDRPETTPQPPVASWPPPGPQPPVDDAVWPPAYPPAPGTYPPYGYQPPTDGLAVAALVLGCAGIALFWLFAVPCILALIFGLVSYRRIRLAGIRSRSRGMAIAGIALGGSGVVLFILELIVLGASTT